MSQDSLGNLLGETDGGMGKVLQDLFGGSPSAGPTRGGPPLGDNPTGAIPMPGPPTTTSPQGQSRPGQTQGQPQTVPTKPPGLGGGFGDLLDRLRNAGLGEQVDSWVGKGRNQPINANQVTQALGPKEVHDLAEHAGLPDAAVADGLARTLPEIVDRVTPQGQLPTPDALQSKIQRLLGG